MCEGTKSGPELRSACDGNSFVVDVHHDKVLHELTLHNFGICDYQSSNGVWNRFGGKLAWGPDAIVGDDPNFQGQGNPKSGIVKMTFGTILS